MKKRLFALIIAFVMVFALAVPCFADEDLTGKLYILHSNDVHGAIDGYEKMAAYRDELVAQGADVILVDAGDFTQGEPTVAYSKGASAVKLMNAVGYDVVTLGNHELDFGYPQLKENMASRTFKLICADVLDNGAPLFDGATAVVTRGGVSVGFVGIETPETQTKVNPALITELTFLTNTTSPTMMGAIKSAVDSLDTDLVIGLAHLGVDGESEPYRSIDMYKAVAGFNFIIDGHSHTVMTEGVNGEPIQSTGTKFANIGVIVIDEESKEIVDHFNKPVSEITANTEGSAAVAAIAQEVHDEGNSALGSVFARSEVELNGDKAPGNR